MKQIWRDFPLKGSEPFKGATARDENNLIDEHVIRYPIIAPTKRRQIE